MESVPHIEAQAGFTFDRSFFYDMLMRIWKEEFNVRKEIDRDAWQAVFNMLNKATDEGFGPIDVSSVNHPFGMALRYNNGVFAAFRQHAMQNEIAEQLFTEDGQLKSFRQFQADVKQFIEPTWLDSWLRTEYDTAVQRAHLSAQWKQFEEYKDILPNLRWVESTSVHPRECHQIFWGMIRSIDDPCWRQHHPGDSWNCKCGLEATDEPVTDIPDGVTGEKPLPGLDNNPAMDAKLFSDSHPYKKKAYPGARGAVARLLEENLAMPEKVVEKRFKSGGLIQIIGRQNKNEAKKNLEAYTFLAKKGAKYRLLPVDDAPGKAYPDALNLVNGMYSDVKIQAGSNLKSTIQNAAKRASAQKAGELYLYLTHEYGMEEVRKGLKAAFRNGRNSNVKEVIIRFSDGEIKTYNADLLRKVFK